MIDLADESKWNQIHASLREVTYIDGTSEFIPLTDSLLPEVYTSRYLRVLIAYPQAKPTWYLGGRLSIRTNTTAIDTPTNLLTALVKRYTVAINRATIIQVPDYLTEYKVSFQPPYWFVYENLRIWEYKQSTPKQSLFSSSASPVITDANDGVAYEMGQRLSFAKAGTISAIRYYKAANETGSHTGKIWSSTGTLLTSVTFTNETASGWQEQALAVPFSVTANTVYAVTVNTNTAYVATNYPTPTTITNGDISGASTGYFGSIGMFPTSSFNNNYFRDVVYQAN